jgi:hypothetical protein
VGSKIRLKNSIGAIRCENGENGCREQVQRRHMKEHMDKCEWKPGQRLLEPRVEIGALK